MSLSKSYTTKREYEVASFHIFRVNTFFVSKEISKRKFHISINKEGYMKTIFTGAILCDDGGWRPVCGPQYCVGSGGV